MFQRKRYNQHTNSNIHQQNIIGKPVCSICNMSVLNVYGVPIACDACEYARKPKCNSCNIYPWLHNYPHLALLLCDGCNNKHSRKIELQNLSHSTLVDTSLQYEAKILELEEKINELNDTVESLDASNDTLYQSQYNYQSE